MGKKATKKDEKQFPGLDLEPFEHAVTAIAELRDSGKLLVFIGRRSSVRIIVDADDFGPAYAEALEREEVSQNDADSALKEVTLYLCLINSIDAPERAADYLEKAPYEKESAALDENGKKELRQLLEAKARLVSEKLFTPAMRDRSRRIATATAPCLEDLDVEVIRERRDEYSGRTLDVPFLRLRLRYSRGEASFPFNLFLSSPTGPPFALETDSFEFECDLSDIDLLLLRLGVAKTLLTHAQVDGEG